MRLKLVCILGNLIGYFFYYLMPFRKKHITQSMQRAFKNEKNHSDINRLVKKNYQHYGTMLCEYFFFNSKNTLKYIEFKNCEYYENALKKENGVLILSAHLGNWEITAKALFLFYDNLYMIARPIRGIIASYFINRFRTKNQSKLIAAQGTYHAILSLLKKNRAVGFVFDQHKGTRGINVDFFGILAATNTAPVALALSTGAVVVPLYNHRNPDGKFIMQFEKPIELVKTKNHEFNIFYNTQIFTKKIEELVRRSPEQWFWMHKRWKGVDNKTQTISPVIPFSPDAYKNYFTT